ncbi:hypothetical protein BKA82DRAFT_4152277 [Pisolithus tinctorius]|nr:hypothetical protein BKA82DRAFT_4152277 [Pisolithus tinctorius]
MSTTTTVGFTIPVDVVLIVLEDLELDDLISLSCTCKFLYDVVNEFGWLLYLRRHERQSFHSRLLRRKPVSSSRLLVAAGGIIYSYAIHDPFTEGYATGFTYEGSYTFTFGSQDTRFVSISHHTIVQLAPAKHVLFSEQLLSLSSWGSVALTDLSSPSTTTTTFHLGIRSWSSHLCMTASTPYAAFGITCTASPTPLFLHYILSVWVVPYCFADAAFPSSAPPPPCSPLGDSDQIVVSGWYDGAVRVHDLRAPEQATSAAARAHITRPWSPEPVYCVSCGGGSASFVAAGTARHSVVAFWDVRQPTKGWSVHAPGNDQSSRLFGGTQSRSFVYDFGPGVTKDTYPSVPPASHRAIDRHLRPMNDGIDYYVLKYNHNRTGIPMLRPEVLPTTGIVA